ncbi:MAG: PQQ-binding-like beta-propeller repeat protein [Fretibacterium sp.]|nr:PQQ-binding-like beta-propeller repeat protein [Fretibacterium sp.]
MKRIFYAALCALLLAGQAGAWRGEVGWTFQAGSGLTSGVAVAGGLVLAGDGDGTLYAVQRASGQQAWAYQGTNTIVGTPSVLEDKVIFAQADGTLTCLRLSDGSVVWQSLPPDTGAATLTDGTAVGGGKVFLVRGDEKLYALSAADGKPLWSYESSQELRSAPAFAEGGLLLGEQGGVFSVIDPESGRRLTGGGAGGAINTPTVSDGSAFFSSWDGSVQRIKLKGNIPQWKSSVGDPVTTPPAVGQGKVFVGTGRGNIAALDAKSGNVLWQFNTQGGEVMAQPVVGEGMVFAGGGQGVLSILNAATGKLLSTFTTGAAINGTPAFEGGVLYLGSGDGSLYAIM